MTDLSLSLHATPPASADASRPGPPATATRPDVSVVIVTYNVREFLEQAIESVLQAAQDLAVEVFVVDNDSADGSADMVRERFPGVRLIANRENTGFATANNQALREARGRYALVLNPDTIVQEDTLRAFVEFMDARPDVGAAGCRILNPDGTFAPESRRAFPTPSVAFYRISGLGRLFPNSPRFGRYNLTFLPRDEVCEVDALSGSCMMVRREAMWGDEPEPAEGAPARATRQTGEPLAATRPDSAPGAAGVFDESFFMYGEDLDWCYRIQRAGWKICYTPSTQIVHYKGESTKKGDLRYVMLFYGAMLRFVEKHLAAGRAEATPGERLSSAALALGLRAGIVARGGLAAIGRMTRDLAAPALDLALAWAVLSVAALVRTAGRAFAFDAVYYAAVLPAYAAVLVAGVAVAGGYRGRRPRRAVALGGTLAFLTLSTAALFVPALAFSRATLLGGTAAAVLALLARRAAARPDAGPRRVLVVGSAAEAARLRRLVAAPGALAGRRLRPALTVVGRVSDEPGRRGEAGAPLGPRRQLRDLARLHAADEVVFASESLTNTAILEGMRALGDLPVSLKILASGHDRIIGKASVEDFSGPLLDAQRTVAPLRPRRRFDVAVALVILAMRPLLRFGARLFPGGRLAGAAALAGRMTHVVAGRRALVGYDAEGTQPPPAWGLQPALVSVLDSLPARPATISEAHRTYWYYARHQSAALDLEILARAAFRRTPRDAS